MLHFQGLVGTFFALGSGRSVAWLARVFRVHEVVSSNLTAPTTFSLVQTKADRTHRVEHLP
jgi:hypothetical protein